MRSILEQALTYLLNEEHEKAEELFHQFVVERARQIHESLRQGDDAVLEENWDQEIASENYFTEEDLSDAEDDGEETDDVGGDDDVADFGGDDAEAADDVAGDMGAEGGGEMAGGMDDAGEGSVEDRVASLEDELARLTAEFEELMGTEEVEHGEDFDHDGAIGDEAAGGMDDMAPAEHGDELGGDDFGGKEEEDESFNPMRHMHEEDEDDGKDDALEEEFDDITESIVNELEKVSVTMTDGKEIAAGKSFSQNKTSPIPQKKVGERKGAKPVTTGLGKEHSGYDREQAPPTKEQKHYTNAKKKAEEGRKEVSKEGDKSAELNKLSSESGNLKSPIGSKGTVGNDGGVSF